jgi:phenylacetate-CoA ligase
MPHYLLVVERQGALDTLEVWVEVDQKVFSDEIKQLRAFETRVQKEIENVLGIDVKVKLVEPKTIERSEGKAKRVMDKRKI